MANENKILQDEEMEVLSSIFGDELIIESENSFKVKILNKCRKEIYLDVTLSKSYPLESPPKYDISAPWMPRGSKKKMYEELDKISSQHIGQSLIYFWIDFIKDFIEQHVFQFEDSLDPVVNTHDSEQEAVSIMKDHIPDIAHGTKIRDRKSVFQAHLAHIVSVKQVEQVLHKLKENKKIATATHNIYAYRIKLDNGILNQDCEDDGETKAGAVLIHLLEVLNLTNVMIIVTRWYGGIHLGSARFKHISDSAKNLIDELGLIKK